jgi:hypothetical protein
LAVTQTTRESITLTWAKNHRPGYQYKLFRQRDDQGDFVLAATLDNTVYTYTDQGLRPDTQYNYYIISSSTPAGGITTDSEKSKEVFAFTVNSEGAPNITKQPGIVKAVSGGTAEITITAALSDPDIEGAAMHYQWRVREVDKEKTKSGRIVYKPWRDIPGANTDTLTITDVSAGMNENLYLCKVRQVVGDEERTAVSDIGMLMVDPFKVTYSASGAGDLSGFRYVEGIFEGVPFKTNEEAFESGDLLSPRTTAVFKAHPDENFFVEEWSVTVGGETLTDADDHFVINGNQLILTGVTQDAHVTAMFQRGRHTLTFGAETGGTVMAAYTASGDTLESGAAVIQGRSVTLTAMPDAEQLVARWIINGEILTNADGLYYNGDSFVLETLTAATEVIVEFEYTGRYSVIYYALNQFDEEAMGCSVSAEGDRYDAEAQMADKGSSITFTAHDSNNAYITEWRSYHENGGETDKHGRRYDTLASRYAKETYTVSNIRRDTEIAAVFYDFNLSGKPILLAGISHNDIFIITENELALTADEIEEMINSEAEHLVIIASDALLIFDKNALASLHRQASRDIVISIGKKPTEIAVEIEGYGIERPPYYAFNITADGLPVTHLGDGMVDVAVVYELPSWASPETVMMGNVFERTIKGVVNSRYANGAITFKTNGIFDFVVFGNSELAEAAADGNGDFETALSALKRWFETGDVDETDVVTLQMFVIALGKIYGIENVRAFIETRRGEPIMPGPLNEEEIIYELAVEFGVQDEDLSAPITVEQAEDLINNFADYTETAIPNNFVTDAMGADVSPSDEMTVSDAVSVLELTILLFHDN